MKLRPTVHFTITDESADKSKFLQISTLTDPDSSIQRALHQVLTERGMSSSDYEVLKAFCEGDRVKIDKHVENHQSFEVVIRRKRQKSHGRPKGKKVAPYVFKVIRTVVEEIVDEIRPPEVFLSRSEDIDGPIATTSKITVHLRVKTIRPDTIDLVDEYPWVKLSSSPWHVDSTTTAVQFITKLVKKGFLNEVIEFKLVDSDGNPQEIQMNSFLKHGQVYSAVICRGIERDMRRDDEKKPVEI
ncbi:unnamed protein product [Bursaphelenchus xylophilus]|uniref:(pine wood nematode) hypothetical protein n=1 Tax=Bursaphelenchus xylophilus TaxID=6326 RepID=A0A1I7SDH0_BURXY|nr:unnamed protein product [Bursaphelenchus xylophilus]CAG9131684.1 unnamed protein product [Bursaphelenchus xylophilus]